MHRASFPPRVYGIVVLVILFPVDGPCAWILYMQESFSSCEVTDNEINRSLCHFVDWHDCTVI